MSDDERRRVNYLKSGLEADDSSFDAVFCHAVLEHLPDPVAALQEMQ